MWLASIAVALARPPGELPQLTSPTASAEHVRLVFIGDTGKVPEDDEDCAWRADGSTDEKCHISLSTLGALRSAMRAEQADAIYALGDLVYWRAPKCREPDGRDANKLQRTIGDYFEDLGAPVYLLFGNHDKGQKSRSPARVRCLIAYAADEPGLHLPSEQYTVDHGLAQVVVLDTNRRDTLPDDLLRSTIEADEGWVVVAAHHELRTAFDKEDAYSNAEMHPGRWLTELGMVPDLWANGHAHFLQLGVFDARTVDGGPGEGDPLWLPAITSGAGAKLRPAPTCADRDGVTDDDRAACARDDEKGMPAFSMSRFGYAVVDLTPQRMEVRMVDFEGDVMHRWERTPDDPHGQILEP